MLLSQTYDTSPIKLTEIIVVKPAKKLKAASKKLDEKSAKKAAVAKAQAVAPKVSAPIGSTPKTKYRGNPDIFGRLVEDHDRHRALFAMIEQTEGKSKERKALFNELVHEIKGHAAAEEQALWSTVLRNPATTEHGRHAVGEHKEMDKMLADLAARDMSKSGWLKRFGAAKEEYLHHIKEEEQEQFVAAEKHLAPADLRYMRTVFNRRKREEKATAVVEKKIKLKA
jgi:Hemerythrin HHE cation binding domain